MRIQASIASLLLLGCVSAQSLSQSFSDVLSGKIELSTEMINQMYSQF
jgi:cathepsin H